MKFRTKLTAIFSGIVLFISLVVSVYVYYSNTNALEIQIKKKFEELAFHTMDQIDRTLFDRFADIKIIASDRVISSKKSTPKQITKRLIDYRNIYKTYASLSFFDLDRVRIADTSGLQLGKQDRMFPYLEEALQGNVSGASDIHISEELRIPVIYFSSPVKDRIGEISGVVVARIPASKFYEIIGGGAGISGEGKVKIDLVNKDFLLLYSNYNRKGILHDNLSDREAIRRVKAGEYKGSGIHKSPGKEESIYVFVHEEGYLDFPGNKWTLIINISAKEAFSPALELRNKMLVLLSAILAFAVIIGSLFSRTISRPIIMLRDAAIEIGKGKLDTEVKVISKDEIGDLSQSFNEMIKNLKKVMASRNELEKEIIERNRAEEALQESEERYRILVEAASLSGQAIMIHQDREGIEAICAFANNAAKDITGYKQEELEKFSWFDILNPLYKDSARDRYRRRMGGEDIPDLLDLSISRKDGAEIPIELSSIRTEFRGENALVTFFRDITERKRAGEKLKTSLKEKEVLLRELYHRTKNNMQVIIAMLHLQSQSIEDEKILQIFKETENRIKSMALVHEKLYQTKDLSRIDLKEYFNDLLSLLKRSYKDLSVGIRIKTDMDSVSVTIDYAIPCGLIINELISNSFKHAFPGDRKGEIIIELNLNDDDEIEIRVRDDGIGLPTDFDIRKSGSYGLKSVISLTEHQLQGKLDLMTDKGIEFRIRFKEAGYKERV